MLKFIASGKSPIIFALIQSDEPFIFNLYYFVIMCTPELKTVNSVDFSFCYIQNYRLSIEYQLSHSYYPRIKEKNRLL